EADHFAADALLLGGATRDHAFRGGQDSGSHSAENAWEPVLARVDAPARLGDPAQVGDHALAAAAVLELDDEQVVRERTALLLGELGAAQDAVAADVTLLEQQARDLLLEAGGRHARLLVERLVRVADAGEHVRDRVGHHFAPPSPTSSTSSCRGSR